VCKQYDPVRILRKRDVAIQSHPTGRDPNRPFVTLGEHGSARSSSALHLVDLLSGLTEHAAYTATGYVSGASPVSQPAVRSSGSTARVVSTWIMASNWSGSRARK
jgi:hypothetical protein